MLFTVSIVVTIIRIVSSKYWNETSSDVKITKGASHFIWFFLFILLFLPHKHSFICFIHDFAFYFFFNTETNCNSLLLLFFFLLAFVILLDSRIEAPCLIWVNVSIILIWTTLLIFGEFILMELGKLKRDTFVPMSIWL